MGNTDPKKLMDLDECVIEALELFADPRTKLPAVDFSRFSRPLVLGSGNAAATGRIMYTDKDAVFADESTYKGRLRAVPAINGVVLISASAIKHAPGIAKALRTRKPPIPLLVLTCNKDPKLEIELEVREGTDKIIRFPSNPEPYTYNTSTYMGMILAKTQEDPKAILRHIRQAVDPALHELGARLGTFDDYFLLVPENLDLVRPMLSTKFIELFGRRVARDVFTIPQAMHATTLVPCNSELFLSFGVENAWWGTPERRLYIPLPSNAGHAAMMAIGYYVIGKIQAQKVPFFKNNVETYCKDAKTWFGDELPIVVTYG